MLITELRRQATETEETLRLVFPIDREFYLTVLDEWTIYIYALKSVNDPYPWDRAVEIEEQKSLIEARLPDVTDEEFDKYTVLMDMLGVLL